MDGGSWYSSLVINLVLYSNMHCLLDIHETTALFLPESGRTAATPSSAEIHHPKTGHNFQVMESASTAPRDIFLRLELNSINVPGKFVVGVLGDNRMEFFGNPLDTIPGYHGFSHMISL